MFGLLSRAFRRSERAQGGSSPGATGSGGPADTPPELRRIVPPREDEDQVTGRCREDTGHIHRYRAPRRLQVLIGPVDCEHTTGVDVFFTM